MSPVQVGARIGVGGVDADRVIAAETSPELEGALSDSPPESVQSSLSPEQAGHQKEILQPVCRVAPTEPGLSPP